MNINPKILHSIDQMISDAIMEMEYYGEFYQFVNFRNDLKIPTCGVNVDLDGVSFYYNEDFVGDMSQEEMNFIMIHEIFHVLWDHQSRIRRGGYDQNLSNIVQDMIINDIIIVDIIQFMKKKKLEVFAKIPIRNGKIFVYTKPVEYRGKMIFEDMYEWLMGQKEKYLKWLKEGGECPVSDYIRKIFDDYYSDNLDMLDEHMDSEIPEELKRDLIEEIKRELKARGLDTDNIKQSLNKLIKHKKDYLKDIKIATNELFGDNKEKTITKKNRRSIEGLKGKRKENYSLNVILDTSGSMKGYFEQVLSYIFQNNVQINLIQCDTEVKSVKSIKNKKQLIDLKIIGMGGTKLQKAVNYIADDKKLKKLNVLILTDGFYEPNLNLSKLKKVLILTVGDINKLIGKNVKIISIKK